MIDVTSHDDVRSRLATTRRKSKFARGAGHELRNHHEAICRYGVQLLALHDGEMANLIQGIVQSVGTSTPRVVVLGQDQAGKTTLINTLIGRQGFLPTGPTGITRAVTRLHFESPVGPNQGAKVTFVTNEELRDRTSSRSLNQRLSEVGKRIGLQVADRHASLLGTSHDWTGELHELSGVAEYFTGLNEDLPRLVKTVDLYFDSSPLLHPVTFIDTPAIRGSWASAGSKKELAEHVERADVCIVVLRQVTAASDIDLNPMLLEVLRGVPKDRIIVYMNNFQADGQSERRSDQQFRVKAVERLLRQKLHQNVTAIAGANSFGAAALNGTSHATLVNEISKRIQNGPFAQQIADAASVFRDVAEARETAARSNAIAISRRILDLHNDRMTKERTLQNVESLIEEIRHLCEGIDRSCAASTAAVRAVQTLGEQQVREVLERQLKVFLTTRSAELRSALRNHKESEWRCDTVDWRREIEAETEHLLGNLRLKLYEVLRNTVDDFRKAIQTAMPEVLDDFEVIQPATNFQLPKFEIPIDPIAVKLDHGGWSGWFRAQPSPSKVTADFRKLLTDEFERTTRNTIEQMKRGFSRDGAAVLYRISQKSVTIIGIMLARREQLVKTADNLIALRHEGNLERQLTIHALDQEHSERVILSASQIKRSLSDLLDAVNATRSSVKLA